MAEFHEVLFPPHISYGSAGGPRFKTTIFTADSGHEQRNIDWSQARGEWDVAHSMRDLSGDEQLESIEELAAFFMARNGRMHGFRFRDPADCELTDQLIGVGDGETAVFKVVKTYRSDQAESGFTSTFTRPIHKLEWDSVAQVSVNGVIQPPFSGWSASYDTGEIVFTVPPPLDAPIVVGEAVFHVPARFDTDHCDVTAEFWNTASWPNIPIIELRN